jgi:hypothetical protein
VFAVLFALLVLSWLALPLLNVFGGTCERLCHVGEGDLGTTGPTIPTTVHVIVGVTDSRAAPNP